MEFYRWNGNVGKTHVALEVDGPVCGNTSLMAELKERYILMANGFVRSLDHPSPNYSINEIVDCQKCLKWFWKQRWIERDKLGSRS